MKRFLSLFIALILAFSMFAVTAIAFAEDNEGGNTDDNESVATHEVSFDAAKFKSYVYENQIKVIEMSKTFMLDGKISIGDDEEVVWYKNYKILHEIFPGINYIELKDEDFEEKDSSGENGSPEALLLYILDLPDGVENADEIKAPDAKLYYVTQHVSLAKAPEVSGYLFAGWSIEYDGMPDEYKDNLFAADYKFNMPNVQVRATANWVKVAGEGEEQQPLPKTYANDQIYVLYTSSDSKEEMDKWDRCLVSNTFSVTTAGPWAFRFAVADGIKVSEKDHTFDWEDDILVTTFSNVLDEIEKGEMSEQQLLEIDYTLRCTAEDTTNPEVKLSTSMKNKVSEGLTVGTTYSISTALDIEDASSTTVYYVVYKFVDGAWKQIFDSKKSEVAEGYEENISKSGVITPLASDVKSDKTAVYKIEYTVVDAYGYKGIHVDKDVEGDLPELPTMLLHVNAQPVAPKKMTALDAWKIVLYVIAGLSAIGIVVLLFIKPKQETAVDARYSASSEESNGEVEGEQSANNDQQE